MKRVLKVLGRALLTVLLFALSLVLGVLLHAGSPAARRAITQEANAILGTAFVGQLRIEGLEQLGAKGLRAERVMIVDGDGVLVLTALQVDVGLSIWGVLRSALGENTIAIDRVRVGSIDVALDEGKDGLPRIAHAFDPRKPSAVKSPPVQLHLLIDDIEIRHVWAHGLISGQRIDADLDRTRGRFELLPGEDVKIEVLGTEITGRALPRDANPHGKLEGSMFISKELHAKAHFAGTVGAIPVDATFDVDGEKFAAHAVVPKTTPESIRALVPEAPIFAPVSAEVNASGTFTHASFTARAGLGDGSVVATGTLEGTTVRAHVQIERLDARSLEPTAPATEVSADLEIVASPRAQEAKGWVASPGVTVRLEAVADREHARATWSANLADAGPVLALFDKQARYGGRGTISGHATYLIARNHLDADVSANLYGVRRGADHAATLKLDAKLSGEPTRPLVDATLSAEGIGAGGIEVAAARVTVKGGLDGAEVRADITPRASGSPVSVAAHITFRSGKLIVESGQVTGIGEGPLGVEVRMEGGAAQIDVSSKSVDFQRLSKALGLSIPIEGEARIEAHLVIRGSSISGRVTIDVTGLTLPPVKGLDAHLELSALEGAFHLVSRGSLGADMWFSLEANDVRLKGGALDASGLLGATGSLEADVAMPLARAKEFAAAAPDLEGRGRLHVSVRRPDEKLPEIQLGFAATGLRSNVAAAQKVPAVDAILAANLDPVGHLKTRVELREGKGSLVSADASTTLPYQEIIQGRIPSADELMRLPLIVDGRIETPEVKKILAAFGYAGRGKVDAKIHAEGTVQEPKIEVSAKLTEFRAALSPITGLSDVTLEVAYEGGKGHGKLFATTAKERWLKVDFVGEVPENPNEWTVSLDLAAHDFPLHPPSVLDSVDARGRLDGEVHLTDYHKDTRLRADLLLHDLTVGALEVPGAKLSAAYDGRDLKLDLRVDEKDGELEASGHAKVAWGAALAPTLDASASAEGTLHARKFKIAVFQAFVPPIVDQIDGRLDADLKASFAPGAGGASVLGSASLTEGVFAAATIGEYDEIAAKVTAGESGTLRIEGIQARSGAGILHASGRAQLAGLALKELRIDGRIARREAFPILAEGQRVADFSGVIGVTVKPKAKDWTIAVDVPNARVDLPDSSRRVLQALEASQRVEIGVRKGNELVVIPTQHDDKKPDPSKVLVHVHLGSNVQIEQEALVKIALTGDLDITVAEEVEIRGQIVITRGHLEISGNRFQIDQGTVTFRGPADNPVVLLTAHWVASDNTVVYANYTGPLLTGKVTLRSEPGRPRDEILSLLVFGTADGPQVSGQGPSGQTAVAGRGGSYATQPVNKALEQIVPLEIRTRVDTSKANPRPEVEVQLARNISATIGYVLGLPPPGANPDRAWLTLIFRFGGKWSLDTTVGNQGSSIVEMNWQHRY